MGASELERSARTLPSTPGLDAVAIADVDRDGCTDIVGAGGYGRGMIHLGDGGGGFDGGQDLPQLGYLSPATSTRVTLAVDDLTGDGRPELVIADQLGHAVMVYRNTSTAAGGACYVAPPPPPPPPPPDDQVPVVTTRRRRPGRRRRPRRPAPAHLLAARERRGSPSGRPAPTCSSAAPAATCSAAAAGTTACSGSGATTCSPAGPATDLLGARAATTGSKATPATTRSTPATATTTSRPAPARTVVNGQGGDDTISARDSDTRHDRLRRRPRQGHRRPHRRRQELRVRQARQAPRLTRGSLNRSVAGSIAP